MSGEGGDGRAEPAGRAGAQSNAAHDGGTQYITGGGDVKSVNVFLGHQAPAGETDTPGVPKGKMSTRVRAALVASGFGIVTLVAALTVYATNSPRAAETAATRDARPSTTASASPTPSVSASASASVSPTPSHFPALTPPAAPPVAAPAPTNEPTAPRASAAPSKSGPSTTHSLPYPSRGVYCSAWQTTNSANVLVRACTQAVDGIGRAFFGAEIENRGEETTDVSVLVKYVVSQKTLDCPRKPDPWTGVVITPGDSWRTALTECQIDGLKGRAVQTQAWAVAGTGDPRGSRMASSPTVHIKPDGTVFPPTT